jgi:hypothetical protein
MLDFAMKVALEAYAVGEADFTTLAQHGFEAEDAWDIAAIASFFAMSNRLATATSMRANEEFYSIGRQEPAAPGSAAVSSGRGVAAPALETPPSRA